ALAAFAFAREYADFLRFSTERADASALTAFSWAEAVRTFSERAAFALPSAKRTRAAALSTSACTAEAGAAAVWPGAASAIATGTTRATAVASASEARRRDEWVVIRKVLRVGVTIARCGSSARGASRVRTG